MKRSILVSFFFLLIIGMLIYHTNNANKKIEDFFILHNKISNIINLNKNFDIFMSSSKNYNNYDTVQNNINAIRTNIDSIVSNPLFISLKNPLLKESFTSIQDQMNQKIELIYKIISRSAILNNSYRYIQNSHRRLNTMRLLLFTLIFWS